MHTYYAPLKEMRFVLRELAGIGDIAALPGYEDATPDFIDAVLEEAARFAGRVLAPLNASGDSQGARWEAGTVVTPNGFKQAYRQFTDAGWNSMGGEPEYGGQSMPKIVNAVLQEMWKSANLGFSLCPLLTSGAVEALSLCGTPELKHTYLPKMIAGAWAGTMNLTEPQAGSDLAAVRTRAVRQADGTYRVSGQKIFITYGEHDLTENIIHLVLARTPGAPEGTKGISMFIVPKFLVNPDGSLGPRNDVHCLSIEHKLGIHASPTCVLAYGDNGGATGYLVGEENRGIEYMFIMMNNARYAVGLEGLGMSEVAYQKALAYARSRVQGRAIGGGRDAATIINHPDVRRMLMLMKCKIEAMRALAYVVGVAADKAARHPDLGEQKRNQAFVDLMIPVVKAWNTETGVELASLGIQVHGGMGYIEETGAAQYLRDVRITPIYEGTTGIQANDLMWRKVVRDGGAALRAWIAELAACEAQLSVRSGADFEAITAAFAAGVRALVDAATHIGRNAAQDPRGVSVGAAPFLTLMGSVAGGWQVARAAMVAADKLAGGDSDPFFTAKIATARFYADHVLSAAGGLAVAVKSSASGALAIGEAEM